MFGIGSFMDYFWHSLPLGAAYEIGAEEGVFSQVGLANDYIFNLFHVHPNPIRSNGTFYVSHPENIENIIIYDMQGRVQFVKDEMLDVPMKADFGKGIFLLRILPKTGMEYTMPLIVLD